MAKSYPTYSHAGLILGEAYKVDIHPRISEWYYTISSREWGEGLYRHVNEPPVKLTHLATGDVSYVMESDVEVRRNSDALYITFRVRVPTELPGIYGYTTFDFAWGLVGAVELFNHDSMTVLADVVGEEYRLHLQFNELSEVHNG